MRRREFITLVGTAAMLPLAAHAQRPASPVVGFLSGRSLASDAHLAAAFRQGLSETGHIDGQSVAIEFRWADGQLDRLPALAADLVRRQVAVIFAGAVDVQIRALNASISTTPIVFATGGDPVELGLGASFNRPGGNATAVTVVTDALWPKRLELLRELSAQAAVVAVLVNPDRPQSPLAVRDLQAAARGIGQSVLVLNARAEAEFDNAFATLKRERADGLIVADDAIFMNRREKLVALAAQHAVPAIYGRREFPAAGGLMSYGASTADQYRQSGIYAGRILKGDKPADLPFLQPTKFELIINLKTAKALGLTVPLIMQMTADEVIE
jgi:putative tryptophan/tyrosine transport system substrate-binding protein